MHDRHALAPHLRGSLSIARGYSEVVGASGFKGHSIPSVRFLRRSDGQVMIRLGYPHQKCLITPGAFFWKPRCFCKCH